MRIRHSLFGMLCICLLCPVAQATGVESGKSDDFQQFCSSWMGKLRDREHANIASARVKKDAEHLTLEYTGYSDAPLKCEQKSTGVADNPFIGKLVYFEIRYQKSASDQGALQNSKPTIIEQTKVMEIFRFDGKRWIY
jgi:hypothetical protein